MGKELWRIEGESRAPAKRFRKRTVRRWALPALAAGTLVAALATVVRRGEEGRLLSRELDRLEAEEQILDDRLATERARADSLEALPRMEAAAREIGLRQAEDGEFVYLSDRVLDTGEDDEGGEGGR